MTDEGMADETPSAHMVCNACSVPFRDGETLVELHIGRDGLYDDEFTGIALHIACLEPESIRSQLTREYAAASASEPEAVSAEAPHGRA